MKNRDGNELNNGFIVRRRLLAEIWQLLKYNSVMLVGPGGVGKTAILKHMESHPESGFKALYFSAEGKSLREFRREIIMSLNAAAGSGKSWAGKLGISRFEDLIESNNNQKISYSSLKRSASKEIFLIMIDEFTEILLRSDEEDGRQLFDELRHLRMEVEELRMIFAGRVIESIGSRYADLGFYNDLSVVSVSEFSQREIQEYVAKVMRTQDVELDESAIHLISDLSAGSPLLLNVIMHEIRSRDDVCDYLKELKDREASTSLQIQLNSLIHDRFRSVLRNASATEIIEIESVLDAIAHAETNGLDEAEISTKSHYGDVQRAVRLLEQEGFLSRDRPNRVGFSHRIFYDWWKSSGYMMKRS